MDQETFMSLRILTLISMCFVSLTASAINSTDMALDSLRDLQRGVRNGYMEDMSPERQQRFLRLLSDASATLYGNTDDVTYSCIAQGGGWYAIVNTDTNEKLGDNTGLSDCKKSLPAPGDKFACIPQGGGWYALYTLTNGKKLGENTGYTDCTKAMPKNDAKFACVAQGGGWYAVYNLKTGKKLGENTGLTDCNRSLPGNN